MAVRGDLCRVLAVISWKLVQFQAVAGGGGETGLRAARNSGPLVREVPSGGRSSRGQQVRGPGVPVDELGVAALGADGRPALLEVGVFDVEGEDLAGPGGGLVQHPPQRLFGSGTFWGASTAFTESAVNQVISKRMVRKQRMPEDVRGHCR